MLMLDGLAVRVVLDDSLRESKVLTEESESKEPVRDRALSESKDTVRARMCLSESSLQ